MLYKKNMLKTMAIVCAGAAWRAHLASSLAEIGYKSCLADPDVWYRESSKANGLAYYEYLVVYVDDILSISDTPMDTMRSISELYRLKAVTGVCAGTAATGAVAKGTGFAVNGISYTGFGAAGAGLSAGFGFAGAGS